MYTVSVSTCNCRIHQNSDIHNSLLKISLALKFYHNVGLSVIGKSQDMGMIKGLQPNASCLIATAGTYSPYDITV